MFKKDAQKLISFIDRSPSCYHAVKNIEEELVKAGFIKLLEGQHWELIEGKNYYITRNMSSIIAFKVPKKEYVNYQIVASHSDSPAFKIKENPEMEAEKNYIKLNVEGYGGMLCAPWFDRPLSIAGKVMVKEKDKLVSRLINLDRDLVLIPNVAIHMNREANSGYQYNNQVDMLPLFGDETSKEKFLPLIIEALNQENEKNKVDFSVEPADILGMDLFLYNRMKGTFWGANKEYISCSRLDDLQCAYASLQGFLRASTKESVSVYCVFDNEEVGSTTKQGANSTFLFDTLVRINYAMCRTEEEYRMAIASSFMISADNAHAVHPNHAEKADPVNKPFMNKGIVIKYNANQKYTTDSVSAAIFKQICEQAQVPYQTFTNRSDLSGGSTLGNISNTKVSLNTVDIGLPQLAMHSPYETAGIKDTYYMIEVIKVFYNSCIKEIGCGEYQIRY